ncbi:MAG: class GN sortase [Tahibacter sp.]
MKRRGVVRALFALAAVCLLADASYTEAKAWLAQELLERAWSRVESGETDAKPWPWADTAPVARLSVERLGIARIVLKGDSGRNLAFGPAWSEASALPGAQGLSVISGHRDTHFAFLRLLHNGDEVLIERAGVTTRYEVGAGRIVDARTTRLAPSDARDTLLLVTCYPFDSLVPGGPLRYVIEAHRSQPLAYR